MLTSTTNSMRQRSTQRPISACTRAFSFPVATCRSRSLRMRCAAVAAGEVERDSKIDVLKRAVKKPGSVPGKQMLDAIIAVEKEKLKLPRMSSQLPKGKNTELAHSSPSQPARGVLVLVVLEHGGGTFFPITACQVKFDKSDMSFENGIFLGPIFSLTFKGPFTLDGKVLRFDTHTLNIGIGPWRPSFNLKPAQSLESMAKKDQKAFPFFIYAYADNDIIVARGKSGGVALWKNMSSDPEWQARAGVLQVYN
eukprot:gene7395-522_t